MSVNRWWARVENAVAKAEDERVWLRKELKLTADGRREAADPVMDALLKALRALGEHRFSNVNDYKTASRIKEDINFAGFLQLFRVEQDARPWAQLARTAYLTRLVRRCMLSIEDAYREGGDLNNEWEEELNKAREKRIKRLKVWRQVHGEAEVTALSQTEKRELWVLLSYSLKRSRALSEQRQHSILAAMIDGELSEAEIKETNRALGMLAPFVSEELPACFVPSYEVMLIDGTNKASWGDAEVSVRAVNYNGTHGEESTTFNEEEMLRRSEVLSDLHHPNIVQFFGMSHVGAVRFEMFEKFVENKYISTKDISTQWDIWRSCALVLHYLLERGMSYDIFSREKVLKAYSQDKFVLLGTGISANQDADLSVIPERFVENMKSFAEMIVEDIGRIYRKFGEGIKAALMSCSESAPPHTLEANIWEILQMFCSSCLSKEPAPSRALFALGEIVRKEGTYDVFKKASRNEVSPLSDTDQPIDQVKAAVECFDYNPEPFEKIMKKLDSKCKRHHMNPNDHLVLHQLHSVYGRLKRALVPLPQLVIKSFFRALERFFEHIDNGDNDPNVRFMILKTLESIGHALNTNGSESFKSLRSWRNAFRKNYTSQLADEDEVELINLFERTKRSGYPFDGSSDMEPEETQIKSSNSNKKTTLEPWFIPPYEIEVGSESDNGAFANVSNGKWFYTEVNLKRVFSNESGAGEKCVTNQEAFKREADIWFSLTHPNVIKLYGASNLSASMFFVCEHARNSHLMNFIEAKKEKQEQCDIWRLMIETAVALEHLHARGIIHGDLKCNNILVGNNLNVRLEGFGLSTSHSAMVEVGHEATEYMAPEVKRGLIPNTASDVFSLGVCLAKFDESFCQELDLYKPMIHDDPKRRPSVSVVVMRLNQLANRPIVSNPQSNTLGDQKLTLDIIPIDIDESMRHFKEAVTSHNYTRVFSSFADKLVDVWSTTGTDDRFRRESLVELVQRTLKMADICKNCTYHTSGDILRAVVMINCVESLYQKLESLVAKMDSSWKLKWEADCKEYVQLVTMEFKNSNGGLGDIQPAAEVNHIAERYIGTLSATVNRHASQLLGEVETFDSFAVGKWFVSIAECIQDADEAGAWWHEGVRVELRKLDDIGDLYPNQFHMMCDLWFKLCHPNILKLVGANALESPFVVCAYIDHISLKDYIRRVDSTCEKLQYILYQVALGLCYLETQRIGCNALSCESIYVDPQGCRAIIDLLFADIFEFEAMGLAPSSAECIRALFQEMLLIHSERNDTSEKNHALSAIQSLLAESSISYIVCYLFNGSSSIDLKAAGTLQDLVRKDDEESLDFGALATKSVADDFPGLDLLQTVIVRLQQVTREAQDLDPAKSIVKTFVHLLAVYTQTSPIVQLGLTRWLVVTVIRMHEHLDDFEANAGLSSPLTQIHRLWKRPVEICRSNLTQKWVEWLDTYCFDDIPDRYPADSQLEALTLLEYEYVTHRAVMTAEEQHLYRSSYAQLSESWQLHILVLPPWFVPPYDAQDSAMGTDMALVCQQPSCSATADGCYEQLSEEVVVRQANLWSKLHHRNIVRFIGACHVGVDRFMAFDGSEGKQTLRKYMAMAPRSRSEVWRLLKDAANGLSYLHQNHIAHRSLTLDAILVRSELTSSPTTHSLSATEPIQYKQKNVSKLSGTSSHVALLFRIVPESKVGCSKEQLADRYFTEDIAALGRCIVECVAGVQLEASSRVEDLNIDDVAAKMGKGGWQLVEAMLRGKMLDLSRVSREIDFISIHDAPVVVRRRSKQPNSSIGINMIEESSMQVRQVDAETMLDRLMNELKSNHQMITLVSQLRNAWAQSTAVNREPEVKSKIEEIIIKLYQLVVSQPNRSGRSQRSANTLKTRLVIGALQKEFDALASSTSNSSILDSAVSSSVGIVLAAISKCGNVQELEPLFVSVCNRHLGLLNSIKQASLDESTTQLILNEQKAYFQEFDSFMSEVGEYTWLKRVYTLGKVRKRLQKYIEYVEQVNGKLEDANARAASSDSQALKRRTTQIDHLMSDFEESVKKVCMIYHELASNMTELILKLQEVSNPEEVMMLKYECEERSNNNPKEHIEAMKAVFNAISNSPNFQKPKYASWLISPYAVDFDNTVPFQLNETFDLQDGEYDGMKVVIKRKVIKEDRRAMDQFKRELEVWTKLNHENVVRLYGACNVTSPAFFVYESTRCTFTEYFENNDNKQHMWSLFYQAALGLKHLHRQNIVHGDIRSANLLIGKDGFAKVGGFGFSHVRTLSSDLSAIPSASSNRWSAPKCLSGEELGGMLPESDIYSLGVCIWEVASGNKPFQSLSDKPDGMKDDEWEFLQSLLEFEWSKHPHINNVVDQLREFVMIKESCSEDRNNLCPRHRSQVEATL